MGRRGLFGAIAAAGLVAGAAGGVAQAQEFGATLNGFNEVGELNAETGAIRTGGTGTLVVQLLNSSMAEYLLTFSNLSSPVTMAHIHFGEDHTPGGILVWLCQTHAKPSPVPGTPFCPTSGGTVSGTITRASIVAIPTENVRAGHFQELVNALEAGAAYTNVHTVNFPSGEIRGQLQLINSGH